MAEADQTKLKGWRKSFAEADTDGVKTQKRLQVGQWPWHFAAFAVTYLLQLVSTEQKVFYFPHEIFSLLNLSFVSHSSVMNTYTG